MSMKKPEAAQGCDEPQNLLNCRPLESSPSHQNASGKESNEDTGESTGVGSAATEGVSTRLKMLVQNRRNAEHKENRTISTVKSPDESVKKDRMPVKICLF